MLGSDKGPSAEILPKETKVVVDDEPVVTRRELWSYYCESLVGSEIDVLNSTSSVL